jgi:hypothetical protein
MFTVKNIILLLILFFAVADISAQQKNNIKLFQFHSINNIGLLEGQAGSAFQLQTINGTQYKSWFAGIGLGLDYYRYRTIPLFLDVRKEFGKTKNKFFVYGDGGISFSWVTDKQKMIYANNDKFKNGIYYDAGAGYKISITRNNSVLINIGYSFKKVEETNIGGGFFNPGDPTLFYTDPLPVMQKYDYSLHRFTFKIGWEF